MEARFVIGVCRAHYAAILGWHGKLAEAEQELTGAQEDLTAKRPYWRAEAVVRLGELRRRQGRLVEAEGLFNEVPWHPLAKRGLAELSLDSGDPAAARAVLDRVLRRLPAGSVGRAWPLELLVRAEAALGEPDAATVHLEEFCSIASAVGTRPLQAAARFLEGVLSAARGEREKACLAFEDAVELYDGLAPFEADRARVELARVPSQTMLTARQVAVLRLVAAGLGDRDIAERLVISEHTVHRHMANIYTRLGCSTRAAAVSRATQLGLMA
jgi:LuxR family maltose regulon positive regulatory protein